MFQEMCQSVAMESDRAREREAVHQGVEKAIARIKKRYTQKSEPFYFSDRVLDFMRSWMEGICYQEDQEAGRSDAYYDSVVRPVIKLIFDVYHPSRDITSDDVRTFQKIFVQLSPVIQKHQKELEMTQANILNKTPGKSREQRLKRLEEDSALISYSLRQQWREVQRQNEIIQQGVKRYHQLQDAMLHNQLFTTDFIVRCLRKNNVPIAQIVGDFFSRHPVLFRAFMRSKNERWAVPGESDQEINIYGYMYVLYHPIFAAIIREKIPPKQWYSNKDSLPLFALAGNAIHANSSAATMVDFIKKLEQLPDQKIKETMDSLFDTFSEFENFDDTILSKGKELSATEKAYLFQMNNLIPMIAHAQSPIIKKKTEAFFARMPVPFCQNLLDTISADSDYKTLFSFLMKTKKGRENMAQLSVAEGQNLIWYLYAKKAISDADMTRLITEAVARKDTAFLLMNKRMNLTRNFPAYPMIREYFDQASQAVAFIGSFQDSLMTVETRFDFSRDFITDPDKRRLVARLYKVVPLWAKTGEEQKIFSLLFQGDLNRPQEMRPLMSAEQMADLMTDMDEAGKTAWHYLCQRRSRFFFGRLFKVLHPSFLRVARQKDLSGKTPLDYADADLKFKQVIAEKIPATAKIMNEMGLSITYTPRVKEAKEERPVEAPKAVPIPPPKKQALSWIVMPVGNDKNRDDPLYLNLIRERVKLLPPPQSGSVNVAHEQMRKKTPLQAATLKINYNHTYWRIPYVHDSKSCTIYILPGSDRSETYTNQDYCRLIRNWVKWVNRQRERT